MNFPEAACIYQVCDFWLVCLYSDLQKQEAKFKFFQTLADAEKWVLGGRVI
jgi:hypothetical protein